MNVKDEATDDNPEGFIRVTPEQIIIEDGTVYVVGIVAHRKVGRIRKELKYGYHPVARLRMTNREFDFELDTKDLINTVKAKVAEVLNGEA